MKATLHWVSAKHAAHGEVRLYDRLFLMDDPSQAPEGKTWLDNLNRDSLEVLKDVKLEPAMAEAAPGTVYQFERMGYFAVDPDAKPGAPVFNRTVTLKDSYAKAK